ncbi:transcriptional regulator [Brucella endophytica]|uniref:Transcriptional regulator n=1 Tax=Brucella endophytica TaxID=1963359 RepID=A0A916WN39_9HYPH|nr:LysR family transcriptional regulator [Brucella endophytica]GGB13638.1 transcriptional regulator [Brucella endophytica]
MLRDLSDTLAFVKVVQEGSFTAAARVLNTPKTKISRKVRELEERLGAQLLHRTTRAIRLTEAGTIYFQHCEKLVKDIEDAENAVSEVQQHPRGWLRIAAPHWFSAQMLMPILSDFRKAYPDVFPHLFLSHEVTDIIAKDIDVAFRIWNGPLPASSSLTARRLGTLPKGIYAAPSYIERRGMPAHPSELENHACLVTQIYFDRPIPSWPLGRDGSHSDFAVRPVAVAGDPESLHGLLLAGDGLQLTNHMRVRADVAAGRLVRVLPEWSGPEFTLYALRARNRVQPPKLKAFLDFLAPRLDLE